MARTKPFFRHIQHVTGFMARAPESERYPYHDQTECPIGQRVKKSGDWQYYLGRPGEERALCASCAELGREPKSEQGTTASTTGAAGA